MEKYDQLSFGFREGTDVLPYDSEGDYHDPEVRRHLIPLRVLDGMVEYGLEEEGTEAFRVDL